jgi:exonuclease III
MSIKIATLNLCLGLSNKKTLVEQIIQQEKNDIMCLQETDLDQNLDHSLLRFGGYTFESETNLFRSKVGIYVDSSINYVRKLELEGVDTHVIILDILENKNLRIFNIYRSFNPANNYSPRELFKTQFNLIRRAYT